MARELRWVLDQLGVGPDRLTFATATRPLFEAADPYLRLGRVSNLPTVWTNARRRRARRRGRRARAAWPSSRLAISLFYVGGMFLNDAFDREIDARERPERPIPSGRVSAGTVFALGFGLLAGGVLAVAAAAVGPTRGGLGAVASGVLLAGVIVVYDAWHKENPLSPLVMGLCRVLVYLTAALAVAGRIGPAVLGAARSSCSAT